MEINNEIQVTNESTALTLRREVTPQLWAMIWSMAPVMYKSRLFGVTSPEAAAAIMLKGYELGLGVTASFEFIQVIQGKPNLSPRGALAILYNSPEIKTVTITRLTAKDNSFVGCECFMERKSGVKYTARFTMEDANRAGLIRAGSTWTTYPEIMCQWRAVGFCADVVAPDICAGLTAVMKMSESMGVILTETGEVIDAAPAPAPVQPEPAQAITLEYLANTYGGEAILVANQGQLPGTQEELDAIYQKLAVPA